MKESSLKLNITHPHLLKEWDYEKNNKSGLDPTKITFGSAEKIHWKCAKHPEDQWIMPLVDRTSGKQNCPFCSGRNVNNRTCLATTHPELCKEWDYDRNLKEFGITPNNITYGSHKRVWWQCLQNPLHKWDVTIKSRTLSNYNCSFCSGQRTNETNCLQTKYPKLSKEWDYERNYPLTPNDITPGNNKKVSWICLNNPKHKWNAVICDRTIKNSQCPFCTNKKVDETNCLKFKFPELCKEWDFKKNLEIYNLLPENILYGSAKKVYWICSKNPHHKGKISINARTGKRKDGCPFCPHKNQTLIYEYLLNNNFNFKNEYDIRFFKNKKWPNQVDFYLLDYNLFIEYDGQQHYKPVRFGGRSQEQADKAFKKQKRRDNKLNKYCKDNNINILHIDGRKYQGKVLQQYLETEFLEYIKQFKIQEKG